MLPEPNPAPTQKKMILQSDLSSPGKAPQISANFSETGVHEERECSLTEATLQPLFYFFAQDSAYVSLLLVQAAQMNLLFPLF